MKILDRYVLRQFAVALTSTVIIIVGLFLIIHFFSHIDHVQDAGPAFEAAGMSRLVGMCRYYAFHIPEILVLFGPYAILIAAMYTVHQLVQNNELVPMYAVGINKLRLVTPVLMMTTIVSAGLLTAREAVIPDLAREMERYHLLLKGRMTWSEEDVPLVRDRRGNVYDIGAWNGTDRRLERVHVETADGRSLFFDVLEWNGTEERGSWHTTTGAAIDFATGTDLLPYDIDYERRPKSRLSFKQLQRMRWLHPEDPAVAVQMYSRVSYVFTPLVLLLLGLPLMMRGRQRNVFTGLLACLVLSLGFFSVSMVLQRLGNQGDAIGPAMAAWLPILIFGAGGLVLFEGARTE